MNNGINAKGDTWLAVFVLIVWSFGRVLNPLRRAFAEAGTSPSSAVALATDLYVILHVVVLGMALYLLGVSLRRGGRWNGMRWGELALYVYVLVTVLLSGYFLLYQLGALPPSLGNLLPYPFNIQQ